MDFRQQSKDPVLPLGLVVLRTRGPLKISLVISLALLVDCLLASSPMPFVRPNIYQRGFLPSAYLLSAPLIAATAMLYRDISFPISLIASRARLLIERLIQASSCILLITLQTAVFKIVLAERLLISLAVIYALLFFGLSTLTSSFLTSSRGAFAVMAGMLLVFAVTPAANLNMVLFTPQSAILWILAGCFAVVGLTSGLVRGLDRGRQGSGELLGTNEF